MIDPESPTPRDAELIDFLTRMWPEIQREYTDWDIANTEAVLAMERRIDAGADVSDREWASPPPFGLDAEEWVERYRYEVRNLAESIPLVGGPLAGTIVQTQRGEPSPWYEMRAAGQRHHYTLTRLRCGHWEYRYREDAPPEEEL